jgi:hypothetical protein
MVELPSRQPSRRGVPVVLAVAVALLLVTASGFVVVREARDRPDGTAGPAVTAPDGHPSTSTRASPLSAEQAATVETLKTEVSAIRGLAWKRDLDVVVVRHDEMARRVREENAADREKNRERLAGDEATLKLLGLIPDRTDYRATVDDLLAGGVLGFYDDETKELVVAGDPGGDLDVATRSVLVHELTHALTDQHFDFGPPTKALLDADLTEELAAYVALLEGDAELVTELWRQRHLSERQRAEADRGLTGDPTVVVRTPRYLLEALRFPYEDGLEFVRSRYEVGGFAAVDAAYQRPPTSTEHILHPEVYVAGQASSRPALPDVAAATGCVPVDAGALGEFDMAQVLDEHLSAPRANVAAAGWNGDAFAVVRCGSALALVDRWRTDSPTDALQLVEALAEWARDWSGSGAGVDAAGRFSGPSGAGRIGRTGDGVDIVLADDVATVDVVARVL